MDSARAGERVCKIFGGGITVTLRALNCMGGYGGEATSSI